MSHPITAAPGTRLLLSGNEAIARGVWEAGVRVASAYPGTPSTEILENLAFYPDIHAEWSVNEKVALEVALGACINGSRAFCAMKHVGLNVAADALMTLALTGIEGGLVLAVADDVGMSSSQNEQDSRYWGRFAHLPVLEPADSQEAYAMVKEAFALSERFRTLVLLRPTTRVCHVKSVVTVGAREAHAAHAFVSEPKRWVMTPANAKPRVGMALEREQALTAFAETSPLTVHEVGRDSRVGFIASGPAYLHVRESFPDAPVLKLGLSYPLPLAAIRTLAGQVERLVVAEETEPLVEQALQAAGIAGRDGVLHGKDILPRQGELTPDILVPAVNALVGEPLAPPPAPGSYKLKGMIFPRPPTLCVACPHLGVFYVLSRLKPGLLIAGDIGCYTLGAGFPWNALDTTIAMGASVSMAHGFDKAKAEADAGKAVVAVIGDSTFLHMGMQGLLNITYNRGNVTLLLLDNHTTGMTGGQNHPASGRDLRGGNAPAVDFPQLVQALGVAPERIHTVDPYALPTLMRTLREETAINAPSVIITNRPCTLIDSFEVFTPQKVTDADCTGCGNCLKIGCPAISVVRRGSKTQPNGREVDLAWVTIDTPFCTGCGLCVTLCAPKAIGPACPPAGSCGCEKIAAGTPATAV